MIHSICPNNFLAQELYIILVFFAKGLWRHQMHSNWSGKKSGIKHRKQIFNRILIPAETSCKEQLRQDDSRQRGILNEKSNGSKNFEAAGRFSIRLQPVQLTIYI